MATTVEHALRRTTMHLPDRPQTVEPHAMHGRHHQYQHQQRPPLTPTSSSGTPTNPLPLAWSASSRSRTPAINIPYSRTRTNSHSAGSGSGGAGTPDSGFSGGGGGSGTPPSLAMLRDRRMSRHVSSTASGDKDDMAASAAAGSGSWKERIHKATRDRFRDMKADAEKDLRERLGHASGFESAKGMREDHKLAMENLRQAMAEEEVELIRREEENLNAKRHSKRLPRRRDVVIEDDFEDDEVLWQGDGEGLSREERLKAAVLEEQHVLWDAIKRTGGSGGAASGIRSTASTTTNASVGSSRRRDSDGYASDIAGVRDTNQRSSRLRWGTSPSSSKTLPSTPPTQPGAAANPSSSSMSASASASAVDMTMHQRWIPSVSEYAADMREKEKEAAAHAKAKVSPPAKEMRAGTSPSQTQTSSGSWRDWSLPDHMRNSRRAPTPTPGTAQSPPVRSQTPAIPLRAQTPGPTTLKRPIPIPMARAQTPAPAPMQRAHSPVVMAKRSQTPGPGHVRQGSSGSSGVPVAPRMHHRTASESHGGGAGGLFQQELENMAARLRRELAIPSA